MTIMKPDEALFFLSILLSLFAALLFAWGPPVWFSLFPYSSGLRFLLSVELYFLCCALFFALRLSANRGKFSFIPVFCLSFAAIPVFSALVILGFTIQFLQSFARVFDIACWLAVLFFSLRKKENDRSLFSALFLICGIVLISRAVPSLVVIAVRFFALFLFVIERFLSAQRRVNTGSAQVPCDIGGAAKRYALSPRETEVLALLVSGKTNEEIAGTLFISLSTVKTHVASIFSKTGARNRLEASALCKKA